MHCQHTNGNPAVVWPLQDIGEGLVGLLHYQERGQLVAVTSTGSAVILTNSSTDRTAAAGPAADGWTVLLRMKITNAAAGAGLQVHGLRSQRLTKRQAVVRSSVMQH